ncbi:MAG: hypothetical protein OEW99_09065 [Gammaproteobacteria bacterium]|nr:hypothetical protein [Gammaproteobacteria bacterium]MDH5660530.1 hypothetical protein [Gammaproteobacteria bacterium]
MSKPSHDELQQALEAAKMMREQGQDPDFLAKSLLNCHYQSTYLEQVLHAAEHYLNTGLGEREHTRLIQAINKAREADELSAKQHHRDLGLS